MLSLLVLAGFGGWAAYSALHRARLAQNVAADAANASGDGPSRSPADAPEGAKAPARQRPKGAPDPNESAEPTAKPEPASDAKDSGPRDAAAKASEAEKGDNESAAGQLAAAPEVLGLYSLRTAPKREEWVTQLGGTPESETAVGMGLDWLARHQSEGGHWGPDCLGHGPQSRCEQEHPCEGGGQPFEAAQTGLALLALQAGGHYDFNENTYSSQVAKGLHCLVEQQGLDGELVGSQNRLADKPGEPNYYEHDFMYEHAMATFALAEACAVARAAGRHPDAALLAAATKAEKFIEAQQHQDGGWRYSTNPRDISDSSVSGWVMLALKSCREAEIPVNDRTVSRMVSFFKNLEDPTTGRTAYVAASYRSDATTGVGMLVDQFILRQSDSRLCSLASAYLAEMAKNRWGQASGNPAPDYYLWYNCTLAMYQTGGEPWEQWNSVVRDRVQSLQVHDSSCQRGSWPPNDSWGTAGGRIYSTALAVLTLEVYYRFAKEKGEKEEKGANK